MQVDLDGHQAHGDVVQAVGVEAAERVVGAVQVVAMVQRGRGGDQVLVARRGVGDERARAAIRLVGARLGAGFVSLVNIFNPERIVVGGGAIAAGDLLLAPAREEVARHAMPSLAEAVTIVPAHFGAEAGMLGAATLAVEELAG